MFDHPLFLDTVKASLYGGRLSSSQEQGLTTILDEWQRRQVSSDLRWLAYMLATAHHETAFRMQPIAEYGKGRTHGYGQPDPITGQAYYGRGYIQLTHKSNYAKATQLFGRDFVNQPDLALDPALASAIMFSGMTNGWFTGRKLGDYFSESREDWYEARRIVNKLDRADEIGAYGRRFLRALEAAVRSGTVQPPAATSLLRRGSPKSDSVVALQKGLSDKGYPAGPIDGEFGPLTEQAVLAFQKDAGLAVTGVFDATQWLALAQIPTRALPPGRVAANQQTLRELGSETIAETDKAKRAAIGTGVLAALGLGETQTNMFSSLTSTLLPLVGTNAADGGVGLIASLAKLGLGIVAPGGPALWLGLAGAATYLWRNADIVAERRVKDHRTGANIRALDGK